MLPNRHDISAYVAPEIIAAFPAWVLAYDEEGVEDQDEATIKPNETGDPTRPGFVVADVAFADGNTSVGLVGGTILGVETADDADDLRIYYRDGVFEFSLLGAGKPCKQIWPSEPTFLESFPSLLPLRVTPRLVEAFRRMHRPSLYQAAWRWVHVRRAARVRPDRLLRCYARYA
jgi:hypothetical protein